MKPLAYVGSRDSVASSFGFTDLTDLRLPTSHVALLDSLNRKRRCRRFFGV